MILEEFDENKRAVVKLDNLITLVEGMPKTAVTCFFGNTLQRMLENFGGEKIAETMVANMEIPVIYAMGVEGVLL